MANIYDVASAIQQPNFVNSFQQGVQTARGNQAQNISLANAQQGQQDQQSLRALAPQVIAGDPNAYAQAAAINPDQANSMQGAGDAQLKRISGALQYLDSQTTPEAKEAAFKTAVLPYLSGLAQANGHTVPGSYAEAQPGIDILRAKIAELGAGGGGKPLINVGAGGAIFDPNTGKPVYTNPGVDAKPQLVVGGDGRQYWARPGGEAVPVQIGNGGAPAPAPTGQAITPQSPAVPNAAAMGNALLDRGATPEQAAAAVNASAGGLGQFSLTLDTTTNRFKDTSSVAPASPSESGGFLTSAPKDSFSMLSAADIQAAGLPAGTIAQRGSNGKIDIVSKGAGEENKPLSPDQEGIAKALASYQFPASARFFSDVRNQGIIAKALEINPDLSAAQYNQNNKLLSDLAATNPTSGGGGIVAANTALKHIASLSKTSDDLPDNWQPINAGLNWAQKGMSTDTGKALKDWNTGVGLMAAEIQKMVKSGVATEGETRDMLHNLSPDAPAALRNTALAELANFMNDKVQAQENRRDQVLGSLSPKTSFLTKTNQANLRNVMQKGGKEVPELEPPSQSLGFATKAQQEDNAQPQPAAQGSAPAPSARPRAVNAQTGHALVWNGTAWVDE